MEKHEFYAKYANTPLPEREIDIAPNLPTLTEIYRQVKEHDEEIAHRQEQQKWLIEIASRKLSA